MRLQGCRRLLCQAIVAIERFSQKTSKSSIGNGRLKRYPW